MNEYTGLFRLLADTARLRMMRLLARERLNVSELTSILALAQSGVSRNLKLLNEAGLLQEQRNGGWAYFGVDPSRFPKEAAGLWPLLQSELATLKDAHQDDARLAEVLRQRQEDFRDIGSSGMVPGRSWAAWARTLSYLAPALVVADLGCGEGYLTLEVSRWARKVIGVDQSRGMLNKARDLANKHHARHVSFKLGNLENLPLEDTTFDVALVAQVLHALTGSGHRIKRSVSRAQARRQASAAGASRSHDETWVKDRFGDVHLGFSEKQLTRLLKQAGFVDVRLDIGAKRRGDPFTVLIGCARRKQHAKSA